MLVIQLSGNFTNWLMRQRHHLVRRQGFELVVAPHPAPAPRAGQAVAQTQHVAGDGAPGCAAFSQLACHVDAHLRFDVFATQT